ncbi:hypothetical protein [Brevundimonas vesicularis]|uniref:Uncharacterized protein n=1 Tax=Brevundimonas vesicularis TaxID=41276 RepID=A0A1Z3U567_BREVE|nr:hypothetical protein [Brevundimonas vesicularis]ASE38433.1 hypothetical protein CEP68_02335 [Brevundimonas vesicularis]
MTYSNANTSGLENAGHIVWWKAGGVSYYPEGEAFGVSKSCRVEPLVTAASAQARIAELESALAAAQNADADRVRKLETIADLADELINRGGLVNRGVDRGLVVVEKADRSDPHYRLCLALEALKSTAAKEGGEG